MAKTLSNIQEHPKTIILFVSSTMRTKTEFSTAEISRHLMSREYNWKND